MKISKLFHWLYAFLMFLPIVLFIPNALYYGFNEHATNNTTPTINYKYQSNEVNTQSDLHVGNIYMLWGQDLTIADIIGNNDSLKFILLNDLYLEPEENPSLIVDEFIRTEFSYIPSKSLIRFADHHYIEFWNENANEYYLCYEVFNYVFGNDLVIQLMEDTNVSYEKFAYTDYNEIESVTINTENSISNEMYQAWQSTWDLPLLQWTHTSFVAQPFSYITGLFGVPSSSTLNYVFAYFVTISICWLVFDLLMYIPNLAHRWLDKGALE